MRHLHKRQRSENFWSRLEAVEGEKKFGDDILAHFVREAALTLRRRGHMTPTKP